MQAKPRDFARRPVTYGELQFYENKARQMQSQALYEMVSALISGTSKAVRLAAAGAVRLFRGPAYGGRPHSAGNGPALG